MGYVGPPNWVKPKKVGLGRSRPKMVGSILAQHISFFLFFSFFFGWVGPKQVWPKPA